MFNLDFFQLRSEQAHTVSIHFLHNGKCMYLYGKWGECAAITKIFAEQKSGILDVIKQHNNL